MKRMISPRLSTIFLTAALAVGVSLPVAAQTKYPLTADSRPQPGVPKGEVLHFTLEKSWIFPGTFRDYWVYVPAQYTPEKPACVYVNQDGIGWNAPVVFDNLIAKGEMPVTIGVFVNHGRVRALDEKTALDRFNRSLEYDGLGGQYARFLLEELLPDVEKKTTSNGRAIRLSHSGNDRAIGGASSGAVCAFTAAWERPQEFSRVFSAIGTYVGLRGADVYPTLLRKYEPKPIRVFLQDGSADQNIYGGDWWMANQMMERALTFSGYEVQHAWGDGGHNGEQGTAVFPDAMRWLWKGWPAPVKNSATGNTFLNALLIPGEGWRVESLLHAPLGAAENARRITNTTPPDPLKSLRENLKSTKVGGRQGLRVRRSATGPDGRVYRLEKDQVTSTNRDGVKTILARRLLGNDLIVASNGDCYVVASDPKKPKSGEVWVIRDGKKRLVNSGLPGAAAVTLSPDQSLLYVADGKSQWVYSYQIQPSGSLRERQKYYWLHRPEEGSVEATGMCVDRDGRLYVATALGVQVCDQAGRVNCILPIPIGSDSVIYFDGKDKDILHVRNDWYYHQRKLKTRGVFAWEPPVKPAPPRL